MEGEQPQSPDEQPRFLKNVTAWIGGITGIVLALAGLRAAYDQFAGNRDPVEAAAATPQEPAPAETQLASTEPQAVLGAETSKPAYALAYEGDGYRIAWKDGEWVERDNEGGVARYEQQARDDDFTYVINRTDGVRWRWPTRGGSVESFDEAQDAWVDSNIDYAPSDAT